MHRRRHSRIISTRKKKEGGRGREGGGHPTFPPLLQPREKPYEVVRTQHRSAVASPHRKTTRHESNRRNRRRKQKRTLSPFPFFLGLSLVERGGGFLIWKIFILGPKGPFFAFFFLNHLRPCLYLGKLFRRQGAGRFFEWLRLL